MRISAFLRALTLMLACSSAGFGCQIVSGFTVLQITGGTDGTGGSGGSGGSGGTGGTGGTGGSGGQSGETCTESSGCKATEFCVTPKKMCIACGSFPPEISCTPGAGRCEICDADKTCITTCDALGECTSDRMLDSSKSPARLDCGDRCNDITLGCLGPYPCEVVCGSGGCNNLILNCGADSPCKLTCTGAGCPIATLHCGNNACEASCPSGSSAVVTQVCNGSCGCKKTECL